MQNSFQFIVATIDIIQGNQSYKVGEILPYTMFLQRRMLSVSCHLPCDAVYSTVCSDVHAVSSCQVPGFRPGKTIPENILINYVGPQHVQDATI